MHPRQTRAMCLLRRHINHCTKAHTHSHGVHEVCCIKARTRMQAPVQTKQIDGTCTLPRQGWQPPPLNTHTHTTDTHKARKRAAVMPALSNCMLTQQAIAEGHMTHLTRGRQVTVTIGTPPKKEPLLKHTSKEPFLFGARKPVPLAAPVPRTHASMHLCARVARESAVLGCVHARMRPAQEAVAVQAACCACCVLCHASLWQLWPPLQESPQAPGLPWVNATPFTRTLCRIAGTVSPQTSGRRPHTSMHVSKKGEHDHK